MMDEIEANKMDDIFRLLVLLILIILGTGFLIFGLIIRDNQSNDKKKIQMMNKAVQTIDNRPIDGGKEGTQVDLQKPTKVKVKTEDDRNTKGDKVLAHLERMDDLTLARVLSNLPVKVRIYQQNWFHKCISEAAKKVPPLIARPLRPYPHPTHSP